MVTLPIRRISRTQRESLEGTMLLLFPHGGLGDRVVFEAIVRDARERFGARRRIVAVIGFHGDEYDARHYRPGPDEVWILRETGGDPAALAARVHEAGEAAWGFAGPVETVWLGPPCAAPPPLPAGCRHVEPYGALASLAARGLHPRLAPPAEALARARAWAAALRGDPARPLVALHARTDDRDAGRNPHPGDVAAAGRRLRRAVGARLVAVGDDAPPALAGEADELLAQRDPGLGELGAALASCDLYIGGESGPLHLAAAVGAPVVALLAPGKAGGAWGPFAPPERRREVVGRHDPPGGLLRLEPDEVLTRAQELLGARA